MNLRKNEVKSNGAIAAMKTAKHTSKTTAGKAGCVAPVSPRCNERRMLFSIDPSPLGIGLRPPPRIEIGPRCAPSCESANRESVAFLRSSTSNALPQCRSLAHNRQGRTTDCTSPDTVTQEYSSRLPILPACSSLVNTLASLDAAPSPAESTAAVGGLVREGLVPGLMANRGA